MKKIKLSVIGAGSTYTPELIDCFIKHYKEVPLFEMYLMDIDREKLSIVSGLVKRMVHKADIPLKILTGTSLKEALEGSDFVILQIRVDGLQARLRDETIPPEFGCIGQETTGAGGFTCALRTIPVILDICKKAEEYCPRAWVINFTNPSGIITEAIGKYSRMKVIGLCNIPLFIKRKIAGVLNTDGAYVDFDYVGLNHLSWINNIRIINDGNIKDISVEEVNIELKNLPEFPVNPELVKVLGYLPSPYLKYYYHHDRALEEQLKDSTRAQKVMKIEKELLELYKNPSLNEKPVELEQRGGACYSEAAFSIISSIFNNKGEKHIVNVPNGGSLKDIPSDGIVEIPVRLYSDGYEMIYNQIELPLSIKGLIQSVKSYESLTIEASVKKSFNLALLSLISHPLIGRYEKAYPLLLKLLKENKIELS